MRVRDTDRTRRNLILFSTCIAVFMATLDGSIVNITLPVISKYFSVNINSVQWIVTAYLLTISALLLVWGKISDIYGRKILFAVGIVIFTLGSLMCGLSGSFTMLIISRVVQAIGAAINMALIQGIVTSIFPAAERGRALGIVGTVVAIGSLVGPSLGGILVQWGGWQTIFFINIPFGIIGTVLTLFLMSEVEEKLEKKSFDFKGSFGFILMITLLFIGLLSLQDKILPAGWAVGMLGGSVLLFTVFIRYEKHQENPLLDLTLFKNPIFSINLATAYILFLAMFSYIFFMPFYLQYILRMDVLTAGLIMSVYPLTNGILAPVSGWLSDKKAHIPLSLIGLAINTAALISVALLDSTSSQIHVMLLIMALGIGSALFQSPNTSSIMGSVPRNKLGAAGSINAFFRNFGMISGTTVSVMIFMAVTRMGIDNMTGGDFDTVLFLKGFRAVLLCAAAISLAGVALCGYRYYRHPIR